MDDFLLLFISGSRESQRVATPCTDEVDIYLKGYFLHRGVDARQLFILKLGSRRFKFNVGGATL